MPIFPIILRRRTRALRRGIVAADDHRGQDLAGARLNGLDLRYKRFDGANLRGANLSTSDLRYASFVGADLRDPNLIGAQLDHAVLTNACLDYSHLSMTDLGQTHAGGATFDHAIWDQSTQPGRMIIGRCAAARRDRTRNGRGAVQPKLIGQSALPGG